MMNVTYSVFQIDLTNAGSMTLNQFSGFLRVHEVTLNSAINVTGYVQIRLGDTADNDLLTLRYNNKITVARETPRQVQILWPAQPGMIAKIVASFDPNVFDVDAPAPIQQVVSNLASTLAGDAVTVGTDEVLLAAANTDRRSITIQNLGAADIYIGPTGVTTATGIKIAASGGIGTLSGTTAALYGISGAAGNDVRVLSEG